MNNSEDEDSYLEVTVDDENNSSDENDVSHKSATENTTIQETELENNLNTKKNKIIKRKKAY